MTETSLLQGEITENPHSQDLDVEGLLLRFVRALVAEQTGPKAEHGNRVIPADATRPLDAPVSKKSAATALPVSTPVVHTAPAAEAPKARMLSLVRPATAPSKISATQAGDRA